MEETAIRTREEHIGADLAHQVERSPLKPAQAREVTGSRPVVGSKKGGLRNEHHQEDDLGVGVDI